MLQNKNFLEAKKSQSLSLLKNKKIVANKKRRKIKKCEIKKSKPESSELAEPGQSSESAESDEKS